MAPPTKKQLSFNPILSQGVAAIDSSKSTTKKRPYYYMYNRDKTILYYSSQKLSDYYLLNINFFTLKNHLKKKTYYLRKYSFSKKFIDSTKQLNMSFSEVESMLNRDRMSLRKNQK